MPDTIPVAVITNAGGAHLGAYFEALASCSEAEGVALCDPSQDSVALAREKLGNKLTAVFDSTDKLFRNGTPKLALISTEARQAPPLIRQSLEAGCDVFAEKPACVRVEDFAQLTEQAEAGGQLLMLALANRLNPAVRKARELIEAGTFGRPYGIEMHMVADQTRLTRSTYQRSWFADRKRSGGGHLAWLGIHWIDLGQLFMGSAITKVAGFTGNVGGQPLQIEDAASLALHFENGALGTMTSGYYLDRGYHSHIRMWGSAGWIEYTEWMGSRQRPPLYWQTHGGERMEYQPSPDEPSGYTPWVRACLRASAGLAPPPITGPECLRVIRVVFGAYEAARKERTMTV